MDNNMFTSLVPLCKSLIPLFPNLTTLSLQHNQVSTVESPSEPLGDPFPIYPSVTSLNLSHNSINNPTIISSLPAIFPNLTSLRVSANPFFTTTTIHHNHTEDSSFLLTLARLPNLKNLNYSLITEKDRMDGELYYLSVAEKALLAAFENKLPVSTIRTKQQEDWNRYAELCTKYDRENVVNRLITQSQSENPEPEQKQDQKQKKEYPPNSLGARLVKITFLFSPYHSANNNKHPNQQPPDPDSPPLHRLNALTLTIPTTLSIYTLKSLILRSKMGREWGLKPLGFTLHLLCHPLNLGDEYEGVGREEGEEVEIPDSMRRIGDWIDQNTEGSVVSKEGMKWCAVRILLKEGKKESDQKVDKGIDLSKLMS